LIDEPPSPRIENLVAIVVVTILVVACGPPHERGELSQAARDAAARAGGGGLVDMREIASFDWDRMYAIAPYTPIDEVARIIGVDWEDGDQGRLYDDMLVLVVFVKDRDVVGWDVLNGDGASPLVDFADDLYEVPIERDDAVFRAVESRWGDRDTRVYTLGPESNP
jgi:hypothetical protein